VLEAVERGEPMCLTEEPWMTVPWHYRERTLFDQVIDICMDSPAIVTKAKGLKCIKPDQLCSWTASLISDIAALIHKFDEFYARFIDSHNGVSLFWEQCDPLAGHVESEDGKSSSALNFDPDLCFPDLDIASILFMYCKSSTVAVLYL
jgi:hypothetical protein